MVQIFQERAAISGRGLRGWALMFFFLVLPVGLTALGAATGLELSSRFADLGTDRERPGG